MTRSGFDRQDLLAIAVGGVAGAAVRGVIGRVVSNSPFGVTVGTGSEGFTALPTASGSFVADGFGFPWATLIANLAGCLILGAVLFWQRQSLGPRRLLLGIGTGFCGSLTTFSTFAVEVASRLRSSRLSLPVLESNGSSGEFVDVQLNNAPVVQGLGYASLSVIAGAAAFWLGRLIAARTQAGEVAR